MESSVGTVASPIVVVGMIWKKIDTMRGAMRSRPVEVTTHSMGVRFGVHTISILKKGLHVAAYA